WAEEPAEAGKRRFRPKSGQLAGDFLLRPRPELPQYRSLTVVSVQGGKSNLSVNLHARLDVGDYPPLRLRLSNWPATPPRLLAPGVPHKSVHEKVGAEHIWTLTFPAGTPQQIDLSIKGSAPARSGQGFPLPEVHVERGGQFAGAWAALVGAQAA